jgi:hypothetical protein
VTTAKVSMSLDVDVLAETRERAGERGVSAYVNEAVRRQLRRDALNDLLTGMNAEHGRVPEEAMEEVRRQWPVHDEEQSQAS